MRIAIWHNLPSGGGKRALYDQVRGLRARGHHIESWCPPTADRAFLPLADLVAEHVVRIDLRDDRGWRRKLRLRSRVEQRRFAMQEHCRACARAISAGNFDIVLAHSCLFFYSTPIGRFLDLPKVTYLHEPCRWLYEARPRLPWIAPPPSGRSPLDPKRLAEWALDARRLRNIRLEAREDFANVAAFDRILVNSMFSRESVIRAYGLDADVCYLGVDLARFTDHRQPRENLVIGVGAYAPEKNPRLAIEAVALLPEPRPTLAWVGNVAYEGYVEELTALAAARGVVFTPHLRISDEEVAALLNRAAVMIYTPRLEPFGLAPIEASACGVPVVGVAEAGVRETIIHGETGLLVANTPHAIADAVHHVLTDRALARRLGTAARANAETRWSLGEATDRIEQALLARLSEGGKRTSLHDGLL